MEKYGILLCFIGFALMAEALVEEDETHKVWMARGAALLNLLFFILIFVFE